MKTLNITKKLNDYSKRIHRHESWSYGKNNELVLTPEGVLYQGLPAAIIQKRTQTHVVC